MDRSLWAFGKRQDNGVEDDRRICEAGRGAHRLRSDGAIAGEHRRRRVTACALAAGAQRSPGGEAVPEPQRTAERSCMGWSGDRIRADQEQVLGEVFGIDAADDAGGAWDVTQLSGGERQRVSVAQGGCCCGGLTTGSGQSLCCCWTSHSPDLDEVLRDQLARGAA